MPSSLGITASGVESLNDAVVWFDATTIGGSATPMTYSNKGVGQSGMDVQLGAANYLTRAHIKDGRFNLPDAGNGSGNYASVADGNHLDITGDIEIVFKITQVGTPGVTRGIITKNVAYRAITGVSDGSLIWWAYWNGSSWTGMNSTSGIIVADTTRWYKLTRVQSTGAMSVFWADDQPDEPTVWNAAGTSNVSPGVAMPVSGNIVEIGSRDLGLANWGGKFHRAIIRSGIAGTTVLDADFNKPDWTRRFRDGSPNKNLVSIVSTSSASDPLFLPFTGRKHIYFSGFAGSGAWSSVVAPVVSQVDIRVNATEITATADDLYLLNYRNGFAGLMMSNAGMSLVVRSTDASISAPRFVPSISLNPSLEEWSWYAGTFDPATRAYAYYGYAENTPTPPDNLSSWTLLGSGTFSAGSSAGQWSGSLDTSNAAYQWADIMSNNQAGGSNIEGKFWGYQTRSTINGTIVDSLNCDGIIDTQRTFPHSGPLSGTVTVASNSSGRKTVLVTRSTLLLGLDDYLEVPADPYGAYAQLPGTAGNYFSAPDSAQLDVEGQQGTRFLSLPGEANFSYASIPNAVNLQIVGDIEVVARVALDNYAATANQILVSKGYAGEFYFLVGPSNVAFYTVMGGLLRSGVATWASRPANGTAVWLKVTRVASTGVVTFFSAADQATEPSSWTTIGTGSLPTGNSDASASLVGFGAGVQTATNYIGGERMKGKFYRGIIRNGVGGTTVADVDFTAQTIGATSFTATSGQTVTLGGTTNPTRIVDGSTFYASSGPSASNATTPSVASLNINGALDTRFLSLPGSGTFQNTASIPDSAPLDVTGDIDIICCIAPADWTPSSGRKTIVARQTLADPNRAFDFSIEQTGNLRFAWWPTGSSASGVTSSSTAAITAADGSALWVRVTLDVDNGVSGNTVRFFTATSTGASNEPVPTSWTQLGADVVKAGVTSLPNVTSPMYFGYYSGVAGQEFEGKIFRAVVRNGIDGTAVVDVNFTLQSLGATSFTATAGGTVSVSGSARIVDGSTFLFAPGVSSSITTMPNSAALQLVGDRTFTADVAMAKWNFTGADTYRYIISKRIGATGEYFFRVDPHSTPRGCLQLVWYEAGAVQKVATSTVNPTVVDGGRLQVAVTHDVDNGAGGNDVRFFTRTSDTAAWTQLGSTVTTVGVAAPVVTTNGVAFGAEGTTGGQETQFRLYRCTAANGIGASGEPGGAIVLDARFDRQLLYAASFVEASSNAATVTMAAGAQIHKKRDLDLIVRARLDDWTPTSRQTLLAKYNETTAQRSYALTVNDTGALLFQWSTNGAAAGSFEVGSSAPALVDGTAYWLRATLDIDDGSGGSTITFFKADDASVEPVSWTTISTHTVTGGTSYFSGSATVSVGSTGDALRPVYGKIYRATVRNKAPNLTVFDADFSRQIQFATTFIEGSPNSGTVTVNGLGARIERQRDIEIVARVRLDDWSPVSAQAIVSKWTTTGNQRAYQLSMQGSVLTLFISSDGGNNGATEQAGASFAAAVDGTTYWVKATRNGMTGACTFSYAPDQPTEPTTWTSLGTPTMTYKNGPFVSTGVLEVGSVAVGTTFNLAGRVYRAIVRNGIGGSRLADWNAHGFAIGSTTHRDEQGNLWTANGSVGLTNLNPLNVNANDSVTILVVGRIWNTIVGPFIGKGNDFFSPNFVGWCAYESNRTRVGNWTSVATNTNGSVVAAGAKLNSLHVVNPSNLQHYLAGAANGAASTRSSVGESANPLPLVVGKRGTGAAYSDFELVAFAVWKRELNANEAATLVARYS